jgi:hypothetical protein
MFIINILFHFNDNILQVIRRFVLALDPGQQRLVRLFKQTLEGALLIGTQGAVLTLQKSREQEIKFEQTAPTLPTQAPPIFGFDDAHSTRFSSN